MDIHPEAVKLLNKHRGTDFRPGGEHYVENLTATNAISEALNERDTLRAQVAAMREALIEVAVPIEALNLVGNDTMKFHPDTWGSIQNAVTHIRSILLKDQSNDH